MRSLLLQGFLVLSYHRDQYCVLRAFASAVLCCRAINTRNTELIHRSPFVTIDTITVLDKFAYWTERCRSTVPNPMFIQITSYRNLLFILSSITTIDFILFKYPKFRSYLSKGTYLVVITPITCVNLLLLFTRFFILSQ